MEPLLAPKTLIENSNIVQELKQKQNFIPDVIIVDYLNICASAKYSDKSNSYGYIKSICEELRGLAVETNTVLWTATQLNREGIDNSDAGLNTISESSGGPMTFDFLIVLITNEELNNVGQVLVKQLKNRYSDVFADSKFVVGVDRSKMKFYDVLNNTTAKHPTPNQNININPSKFSGVKT